MNPKPRHPFLLATLLALLAAVPAARAQYAFTLIADSSSPTFASFGGAPSINSAGTVAFYANLDAGGRGIFRGTGGPTTPIAVNGPSLGNFSSFDTTPAINSAGTVAFLAGRVGMPGGVFTGTGGPTTMIALTGPSPTLGGSSPSINDAGMVAFLGASAAGVVGIYKGAGGPITTIADTLGPFRDFTYPAIDGAGIVAFGGYGDNFMPGIYSGAGGPLTTIDSRNSGSAFSSYMGSPSMTEDGRLAFLLGLVDGGSGVISYSGGVTTTHALSAGPPFGGFTRSPSINAAGTVAFVTALDAGGTGLYLGNGGAGSRVIGSGDPLFGSTVSDLVQFGPTGLNDAGQLAFGYTLANGRTGIAVASPNPIPEPTSALLLAASAFPLLLRRRRQ